LVSVGGAILGLTLVVVALGVAVEPVRVKLMKVAVRVPMAGPMLARLICVVPFHGSLGFAWAGCGIAWMSLHREQSLRVLKTLVCALAIVCLLLFLQLGIAPLYPWALRRYVVFLVPLLAWAQAFAIVRGVEVIPLRGGGWRWAVLLVFIPALVEGGRISAAAFRVGDYPGLGQALSALERALKPGDVIVTDDPEWGTPLFLAGGRDVVSGRLLWRRDDPDYQRRYMEALRDVRQESGRRFLWLTSTAKGRDLYPVELGGNSTPITEVDYNFRVVNHSARARTYETRPRHRIFRLYDWNGTFRLRNGSADSADSDATP
jgi:hypothetical protein